MKTSAIMPALILLLATLPAQAAKPAPTPLGSAATVSPGELKVTPEMWFYDQQMRQYQDPKMMVRQKAEFHAQQRMRRLESMRWFGFSNARPVASGDPIHGDYSPHWTSNSALYPLRWSGVGVMYPP